MMKFLPVKIDKAECVFARDDAFTDKLPPDRTRTNV